MTNSKKIAMARAKRVLIGLALPLSIAACSQGGYMGSDHELNRLKTEAATGSPFTQDLSKGYLALANTNRDEYNWPAMSLYAHKGMQAAHGAAPEPEHGGDWSYASDQSGGVNGTFFHPDPQAAVPLRDSRVRLMAMLGSDAPTRFPEWAATAQTKFDCWVEATHEALQPIEKAADCRKGFEDAMASIAGTPMAAAPAPAPAPAAEAPVAAHDYQVFFDFDKSTITSDGARVVANAAQSITAGKNVRIMVTGYTDTVGTGAYNMKLSYRRADAVERELIRDGVAASAISVDGKGKTDLLVQTADGVREPQNRHGSIELSN